MTDQLMPLVLIIFFRIFFFTLVLWEWLFALQVRIVYTSSAGLSAISYSVKNVNDVLMTLNRLESFLPSSAPFI